MDAINHAMRAPAKAAAIIYGAISIKTSLI
jgi:hypothetical protein